ncbi:hypothetical protein [Pseudomonas baetica]|uniref:hypothetical protein n=1 Tax=Pseudomonas baetica TaxID=674054 RepID=UPI002870B4DB|nr:hypothetical protein [Pseudomonas baetica]MDR9865675.1 hypothetical protein [Pseudomonas baetica]
MKNTALILAMTAAFGTFNVAHAEGPDAATLKGMYDTGRNMSGLIKHCVDKGFLKADSTENANKMVAYVAGIPGGMDKSGGDKSEAQGRKGEVLTEGEYKNLEASLPANLDLKQWCEQADQGMRQGLKKIGL